MPPTTDPARFEAASGRFVAFFHELSQSFVEREELLLQVALGLLSREHVLMTGPPGTAKSGVAAAVLRRVIDEKTGEASLFARQFTESTVYTDLVGPINFKTLMETGHTEHFTDDGMLGAVHTFLDEVFDGRDMLLRSTLNLLQERELKQGGRTTPGRIECALMTTNRYLAEVLEGSRETLLAFVDRIAFVSFVPRGFANTATLASVLKRQVQGSSGLEASLSIQDLDVLQAVVDEVDVPSEVLDGLSMMLGSFADELAAAERADPQFLATRYLSTRTAVRLGRLLRAVVVYDRLFRNPGRALQAVGADLAGLRSSLILAGPQPEALNALLAKETDPRERRQLSIIRTEREIFDRCLKAVPPITIEQRRPPPPAPEHAEAIASPASVPTAKLVTATRALVADSALRPPVGGAQALLGNAIAELGDRALRMGVTSGASSSEELDVVKLVSELSSMAESIEAAAPAARATARWLRGKALRLLEEAATVANVGRALDTLREAPESLELTIPLVDARLSELSELMSRRNQLRALGADESDFEASRARWEHAVERAESDVVSFLDLGFQKDIAVALQRNRADALEAVLSTLTRPFDLLDSCGSKLEALGGIARNLKTRVVAPRLHPLVEEAFARLDAPNRVRLIEQVDSLLGTLERAGLGGVLAPQDILAMTGEALVRSARKTQPRAPTSFDHDEYRRLRVEDQRVPGAFTLLEIALRVQRDRPFDLAQPETAATALAELARNLPEELRNDVADVDLARLERFVAFFEHWGDKIVESQGSAETMLRAYAESKFFHVLDDERALLRTSLEIQLVLQVFPLARERADALLARVRHLDERSHARVEGLLKKRSEEAWASMLQS